MTRYLQHWLLAALMLSASAHAHDLWIEPTSFAPAVGQSVGARLRVGEHFVGDVVLRDPALVNQFIVADHMGRKPLAGIAGDDPAGSFRVSAAGLHVIGYSSHPSLVELPAEKFNQYLKEEGLEAAAQQRAQRNETHKPVREHFSRYAKSLVLAGAAQDKHGDKALGFTLELVAEKNPHALRAGEALPVRLTYLNRPLAGTLVVAMNRANPVDKQAARTDRDGRVRFQLRRDGMWLIKAVHMERASVMSTAQWTSFWASLTVELRGANANAKGN